MTSSDFRPLDFRGLLFEKVEFYAPHKSGNGTRISNVAYRLSKNEAINFFIETCILKTTSGVIKNDDKYYMDFELDPNNKLYDFYMRCDEKTINAIRLNSISWFNKTIDAETAEAVYRSPIRLVRGCKHPVLRVRIPTHRGRILTEMFDNRREQIDINDVSPGDETVAILEFVGLRFQEKQVFAEWELSKLKVLKATARMRIPEGYTFTDVNNPIESDNQVPTDDAPERDDIDTFISKPEETQCDTTDDTTEAITNTVDTTTNEDIAENIAEDTTEVITNTVDTTNEDITPSSTIVEDDNIEVEYNSGDEDLLIDDFMVEYEDDDYDIGDVDGLTSLEGDFDEEETEETAETEETEELEKLRRRIAELEGNLSVSSS